MNCNRRSGRSHWLRRVLFGIGVNARRKVSAHQAFHPSAVSTAEVPDMSCPSMSASPPECADPPAQHSRARRPQAEAAVESSICGRLAGKDQIAGDFEFSLLMSLPDRADPPEETRHTGQRDRECDGGR